jgi:predicted DNA-binding protein
MADPAKYKSLSVPREDWETLGQLASKTNRTRSKMIGSSGELEIVEPTFEELEKMSEQKTRLQ